MSSIRHGYTFRMKISITCFPTASIPFASSLPFLRPSFALFFPSTPFTLSLSPFSSL